MSRISGDFTNLEIYRLAEDLAIDIYKLSKLLPKEELFGITSQIRRAAISVPLNIAESAGRYYYKDRSQFIYTARGSLMEVKSILSICNKLSMIKSNQIEKLLTKIDNLGVKINNYLSYLKPGK